MLRLPVVVVMAIASFNVVFAACPAECACPLRLPECAPGVSLVSDGCGCCKVCARQLNEDCSRTEPCDHTKGLECNFGASFGAPRGICRAKSEGRPCEYNSRIYQNGESFQPNCKHQCTCIDGAVGCIPLCPQELSLPTIGCADPRLVKVAGQCCEEWVCGHSDKQLGNQPLPDESESDLTNRNELVANVKAGLKSLPAFRAQAEVQVFGRQKCVVQTTAWSPCSRSCGMGISTRVTNDNAECKLAKESRLCELRPCTQSSYASLKKGKKCNRTKRSAQPVRLTYAGCTSLRKYRPRYCGSCVDGRCCVPQQTRTVRVKFRCHDGDTFNKNVMVIDTCRCSSDCPHASENPHPFYRLYNDIHKFRD
ncbi:CCN family member 1 [Electrophorus electricus]|uniref:CCN family member 1 n=1 Tax=Electrophorus electricus TaxID=8005 RepID=A0A4W4G0F0_ELEEL|nr:CCN family member 1 [Electrophorus electricus]